MRTKVEKTILYVILTAASILFLSPTLIVIMNSFKGKLYISNAPFQLPNEQTFAGITNFTSGIEKTGFLSALKWSLFITIGATILIVFFTSMTAWYITRVKTRFTKLLYYLIVFSMVVPFQMVMFTMTKVANTLSLDNPVGLIILYLGFGTGLSTFMYVGFIKSVPLEIEEAAMIDGCSPVQTFFLIVMPMLKPITITIAILNVMWVWNDYLLPYLIVGTDYPTIPIAVQYLRGGYGSIDMGAMMALLVIAIIPIVIFYAVCQKYIIEGIAAGAVKG